MTTIPRLTTRGIRTAEHIRDRKSFTTSGSLRGQTVVHGRYASHGYLDAENLAAFYEDVDRIDYMVFSYSTPIAWHLSDGSWYIVNQSFSTTTSKHQGNLYLIPRAEHTVSVEGKRGDWVVCCNTCGMTLPTHHQYKADAHATAHSHRMNGRTPAPVNP